MFDIDRKKYWIVGVIVFISSLLLLLIGVRGILGNAIDYQNLIAYLIFSLIAATISAILVGFQFKIIMVSYMTGLIVGFFEMFRTFFNRMSGWGDLIGIVSLFLWMTIGLGLGIVAQFGYYLYTRFKKT